MPDGNSEQIRAIASVVADAAVMKIMRERPELQEAKIPSPLKWASAIIAALFTAGTATLAFWLVSSVSEMQVTLARMDERMASGTIKDSRYEDIERRVSKLETHHQVRSQP